MRNVFLCQCDVSLHSCLISSSFHCSNNKAESSPGFSVYRLLNNAFEELLAFQRALKDLVASVDATYAKQFEEFFIGLEGSFGSKHVTPRTLTSRLLGSMVCVEGIVTKCTWQLQSVSETVSGEEHVCVTRLKHVITV